MSKLRRILIPLFISLTLFLQGREEYIYTITDYTPENGLASRFVNYTHKDSRGLFWIGTQNGLHRFDGRDFKNFDEAYGLPFNQVMEIYEDSEGWLWLYRSCKGKDKDYCYKDLAFFHHRTQEVLSFEERFGEEAPFNPTDIEFITTGPSHDKLIITTQDHTYLWTEDEQLQVLPFFNEQTNYRLVGVLDDGKMGAIQKRENKFHYCLLSSEGRELKSEVLKDTEGFQFNRFLLRKKEIGNYNYNQYLNGSVAVGANKWYRIDEDGELIPHEVSELFPEQYDRKGNRHYYFDEKTQSFWAAGREGLRVINLEKRRFFGFQNENTDRILEGLFPISKEEIFYPYGIYNYVNHSKAKELFTYFPKNMLHEDGSVIMPRLFPKISKSDLNTAQEIFPMRTLFLIQQPSGEPAIQRTESFFNQNFREIHACLKTDQGFWLGTDKGFWAYDSENENLSIFENYNEFTEFKDSYIHTLQPRTEDEYWITTNKGLFQWHIQQGILAQYGQNAKGKYFIPSDNIYHLHQAGDGTLWLATRDGLIHLSLNENTLFESGQHFELFTKEEGLLSDICVAVYEDDYGFLWVATDKGLVQFDLATADMKVYTREDGLVINYFREYNHFQAPTGELVFGGIDGIVSFHPKDFKDEVISKPDAPLIIVEYEWYNPDEQKFEIATAQLLNDEKIVLQSGIRLFNLRVCLEDYRNAKEQKFAYRIKGYQEEWLEDQSNLIRISGLPYGNHNLEIKGRLSDGRFSNQVLNIPIRVLKPFWLTTWFFILVILGLLSAVFSLIKFRTQILKRRQAELEQQVSERTAIIAMQTEELRSLDKMKSRFFANISHELRTPLTLIKAPIQNILKHHQLTNQDFSRLLLAEKNTKQLEKMVNQILDLTKLEKGKLELNPSKVAWYNFLRSLIANFESLANSKNIDFQFQYIGNDLLQVEIDKEKVEIIITNLLSNAFKFTPKEGKITLKATNYGQYLEVQVSDNGQGILPKDLPNIFNRFYQSNHKAAEGGTGIGLALSKEFVRLMKGTVTAESEFGKGAVFTVRIPRKEIISQVKPEESEPTVNTEQVDIDKKTNKETKIPLIEMEDRPKILLVEDNYDLRSFIESLLEHQYQVISAENGQEAMDLINAQLNFNENENANQIELIISDLMMPVMDGYQLLEQLKSDSNYAHIPVIILTAKAAKDDKLKALRIGVDDYITKPFDTEELLIRIENLLSNAAMRKMVQKEVMTEIKANPKKDQLIQKQKSKKQNKPNERTQKFLTQLEELVLEHLNDFNYKTEDLAFDLQLSKRHFLRQLKLTTGLTPIQHIRAVRLEKAREYIENETYLTVKEVAYSVGYKDIAYFSRQFKKAYGKLPSEY